MGKKKAPASPRGSALEPEVLEKMGELKKEGDKLFISKEYAKAIEAYERALKALPTGAVEAADLYSNKAACFYQLKKYKEAAKECSNAIDIQPNASKGLHFRAKALEQLGLYKQALADVQAINRTEAATDETREAERRLRDTLAGKRPGSASNGDANGASRGASGRPGSRMPAYFTAKCSLGSETRLVHMYHNVTYAELLAAVRGKFPEAGHILLKYVDRQGDLITLTSRQDVQAALQEVLAAYEKQVAAGSHGPKLLAAQVPPPVRIQVCPVASAADVPKPPEDEEAAQLAAQQQALAYQKALQQAKQAAANKKAAEEAEAAAQAAPANEVYEIDEWLIEFSNLFREMTGVDSDRHMELHNLGWEKTQKAIDAALTSDKALPIFDKAAERFKEVTCTGLLNWGNVHMCVGHKFLDEAATTGKPLASIRESVTQEFNAAEKRYNEAMAFKPDFYDGACALGQLEFERAKLAAGLLVKPVRSAPAGTEQDAAGAQDTAKQLSEALQAALAGVTAASVRAAQPHIDAANKYFEAALVYAEKDKSRAEAEKAEEAAAAAAEGASSTEANGGAAAGSGSKDKAAAAAPAAAEEVNLRGQALIMHGNILYEWSQILGAVAAGQWKPLLDSAVSMFREAGCAEADIRNALKNHSQKEHLDLGPDPEPAAPAPAAAAEAKAAAKAPAKAAAKAAEGGKAGAAADGKAAAEEAKAPVAKGLPSLARKK